MSDIAKLWKVLEKMTYELDSAIGDINKPYKPKTIQDMVEEAQTRARKLGVVEGIKMAIEFLEGKNA